MNFGTRCRRKENHPHKAELMDYERYYGEPVVRAGARERHAHAASASVS